MNLVSRLILGIILMSCLSCGGPRATAHIYTNNDGGSVIWCPEELDPAPTTWTYNGTADVPEDQILEQCELE